MGRFIASESSTRNILLDIGAFLLVPHMRPEKRNCPVFFMCIEKKRLLPFFPRVTDFTQKYGYEFEKGSAPLL